MAEDEISGKEKTEWHDSSKEDVSENKPEQVEETAAQEQQETLDTGKGVNKGREHCWHEFQVLTLGRLLWYSKKNEIEVKGDYL